MEKLKFSGSWRDYQKRILDDLNFHLADDKIHVVAAPGAGKTTLGIEVIARINKPALILTPTITIRNQWKSRIENSFLDDNARDVISTNIKEPKFITIITYQALLASFCGTNDDEEVQVKEQEDEEDEDKITSSKRFKLEKADDIIQILKSSGIKLLCYDEAHHLRREWWKALDYLVENLKPEQSVSLTATPPYDADGKEWERYENLCGPIDEVISIPELVANGDLCPHQDFIHFSLIRKHENEKFREYTDKINLFLKNLLQTKGIADFVSKQLSKTSEEDILENPKIYIAILSYLKASKVILPADVLNLFDLKEFQIPAFKTEYQKIFLSYIFGLKENELNEHERKMLDLLAKDARQAGILQNKTIFLNDNPKLKRQIANSIGKLDSIKQIVDLEVNAMRKDLRMVILADYIKLNNMDASELGVIPIWQTLKNRQDISLAVLTGSIILIPSNLRNDFEHFVQRMSMQEYVSVDIFERDNNFLQILPKGSKKSFVVDLITQMFNEGFITVMVGTQALLGEGWDAPCINSLILSSTVSSYMLSNQMRGRAIRVDKRNPNKISNIWHLASVKILSQEEIIKKMLTFGETISEDETEPVVELSDYFQLCQRFKGFQAPSVKSPFYIESGIERILPVTFLAKLHGLGQLKESDFISLNKSMEQQACNRELTKQLWEKGTAKSYDMPERMLREGLASSIDAKSFQYRNGYYAQLTAWGTFWSVIFLYIGYPLLRYREYGGGLAFFVVCLVGFCICMLKPTIKYLRCSSPEKIMRQIGIVFLETFSAIGLIKASLKNVAIHCETDDTDKSVFFSVSNLSPEENNMLVDAIIEFVNPIENPRYLFVRKDCIGKFLETTDYHAMSSSLSGNKSNIEIFKRLWEKYIGKCDIIYTRNADGRRMLLKARKNAFSDLFRSPKAKHLSRYQ